MINTPARDLLRLANFLSALVEPKKFDTGEWGWGHKDAGCGFRGCALGWACRIRSFRDRGLKFNHVNDTVG